ncbi:Ulvan-active sulfatase [Paenibacillus solanacearum]|uniref:Ulvan-active sulfatase n=1 Tax=Paenibacillus solanacearum TaxID=2048548 RepID=A0A916K2Q7_9BACL|nr:sulfatase [Paenibacillus solanacearum]CAG7621260.1 Ulvan-active sulfatase [Paenibacillus solanacearum]
MNIVFAFADDWGRYASIYAEHEGPESINHLIRTPHVDRIAREGALFKNASVPAPSCTPCRSSILSGRYFWQTGLGAILLGAVWDEQIPSYPLELEKAGYHIGHTYKVWAPGKTKNAPYGGQRTAYSSCGNQFSKFSHRVTERAEQIGVDAAKQELLDEVRNNFDSFIDVRPEGKPFCYWWGPTNTHRTWERGSGKAIWGLNPDDLQGRMPGFLPDVPEVREDFCDYLGECQAFDAGLGVILRRLEELGELDNTLVVVSGDHGIPGMPRAKCNLYNIGCEVALTMRWPGHIQAGRVIEDFVNLMDLAPTFMEAAGVAVPESMTGRSLLPVLLDERSGQVDRERTFVITGRERHVNEAREGDLPYPQRAIRTQDYLYIINFEPERWPMGDPKGLDQPHAAAPTYEELRWNTRIAYADMDASPTKAWMIHHRSESEVQLLFDLAFDKRPREELYDLRNDPYYMHNLADEPQYTDVKRELNAALMAELRRQQDPRVTETPCRFEQEPYAGKLQPFQQ